MDKWKKGLNQALGEFNKVVELGKEKIDEAVDKTNEILTSDKMIEILDECYEKSLKGIDNISEPVYDLVKEYLAKYSQEEAIDECIQDHVLKCTTSGFITSLGGALTIPVGLPANIASVIYMQIRMLACIASIRGYDINNHAVQSLVYACLLANDMNEVIETINVFDLDDEQLRELNQKVGMKLIARFSAKGIIQLGKLVPIVGGVISGGIDFATTKTIADQGRIVFI